MDTPAPSTSNAPEVQAILEPELTLGQKLRARKRRRKMKRYGSTASNPDEKRPSQAFRNNVAILRAEGLTQEKTGKLLDVHVQTIRKVEHLPDVQARIQELRSHWQQVAHDKLSGLAVNAWTLAEKTVQAEDPKGFDNTMRGLVSMEKISSSVSGEGRKIEVTTNTPPQVEVKALLARLFYDPGSSPATGS